MLRLATVLTFTLCFAGLGLRADTLSDEEIVAKARQIAFQAPTRECLLQVAEACRESDPTQALKDYQAAAARPCPRNWSASVCMESDFQIAEAAGELGDAELGKKLLVMICDSLLAAQAPAREAAVWYSGQTYALLRAAQNLYTVDGPRFEQALLKAMEYLPQAPQEAAKGHLLQRALTVLALKEPETAIQRYKAELGNWGFTGELVWNALQADPEVVLAHVHDLMPNGRSLSWSAKGPSEEGQVMGELLAFAFRRDPAEAQQLAERLKLFFWSERRGRLWPGVAATMQEMGAAKLPPVEVCPRLYAAALPELARLDYELAMQLARSLPSPAERGSVLAAIGSGLAPSDLEQAQAAAREALALAEANPQLSEVPLAWLARALAETEADVTPQVFKRLTLPWALSQAFPRWWVGHRAEAEGLLANLSEAQQLHCVAGLLTEQETTFTVAERRAWVQRAMALPCFGEQVDSTRQIVLVTARFDPELARQQWTLLRPAMAGPTSDEMINPPLEMLFALAEALDERKPGSASLEVAEITARLAAAPAERTWPYLYRVRLARLQGRSEPAYCGRAVAEVIASLTTAPKRVLQQAVLAEAVRALSRVDLPAALKVFAEQKEVQGDSRLWQDLMVAQAKADPKSVIATNSGLSSRITLSNNLSDLMYRVARECSEECVHEVAVSWLQTTPSVGNPFPQVLLAILRSGRPQLIAGVPQYLDLMPQDFNLASACNLLDVVFAGDEVLTAVMSRLQKLDPYEARDAMGKVVAAKLERDWSGSQELLNALSLTEQCEVLLTIPKMRSHRERVVRENRTTRAD